MRTYNFKAIIKAALRVACILPFAAIAAFGQQQVNLTAGPATATLPDGSAVPMWGYSCGAPVLLPLSTATCQALNPAAALAGMWSPVVITVPTGQDLTINLTNNLSFLPPSATIPNPNSPNNIPTSLVIVGQLGGGLGTSAKYVDSPVHANQSVTWSTVGSSAGAQFVPPPQGQRVQSFATEVAATPATTAQTPTSLTWKAPRAGTYLIESGTHPSIQGPMGLYGILVVTSAPTATAGTETAAGLAYPGVPYDADVPMLLSEIDPVQNNAVNKAVNTVGFSETAVITLKDSVSSIALALDASGNPIAGAGYSVGDPVVFTGGGGQGAVASVSSVDSSTGAITGFTVTNPGQGYTSVPGAAVTSAGGGKGANITAVLSLAGDLCGDGTAACYPPAVNFTPLYYAINGAAFNKTNASASLFPVTPATLAPAAGSTGSVLVRFVNAGLRMHVPSIVGSLTNKQMPASAAPVVTGGFSIIAEDGNPLPGLARVQNEVFMAAGKTYDVMINATAAGAAALPVYDRELSLSGNAIARDAGMLAYIGINGSTIPAATALGAAVANADSYLVVPGKTLVVSDPSKGVLANDINVYGAKVQGTLPTQGTLTLNTDGTFTYVATATWAGTDSFTYCGNGTTSGAACATVTLNPATIEANTGIKVGNKTYTSSLATYIAIKTPGVLSTLWDGCTPSAANPCHDTDGAGYPLTIAPGTVTPVTGLTVNMDSHGGFNASVALPGVYTFTYNAQNSQGTVSALAATVTLVFPTGSGLVVNVLDGYDKTTQISDYRWVIEEDRSFYIDPACTMNPPPAGCPSALSGIVPTFGVNFHTSNMPYIAQGCTGVLSCEGGQTVVDPNTGLHNPAVCDVGDGVCRLDTTGNGFTPVDPKQVALDPTKRYYISVLPGDAANPFLAAYNGPVDCTTAGHCGHGMGGAPITFPQPGTTVTILTQPSPYPTAKLSVFVFEDDFPLNGEHDGGGGIDVLSPNEPGLGQFQIHLWDAFGGNGDFTGQMTYDMFNQPLTNSLDGTLDPATGKNACPITQMGLLYPGTNAVGGPLGPGGSSTNPSTTAGITGMIVTCPKYEADGVTLSPLAGQAVVANLMPGRWGVIATPGADRIAKGEEWLQTNTLDGQKAHDSFTRIGEPSYFQEFGPASYHVSIGFANPAIINSRLKGVCSGNDPNLPGAGGCTNTVSGKVTGERLSRTPDERLYDSGSHDAFYWTQCFVSVGDPDGEDFAFAKCDIDGNFTLTGLPAGDWRLTTFDQWNDQLVDGLSTPVRLGTGVCPGIGSTATNCNMGNIAATQWQTNLYTQTFVDDKKRGVSENPWPKPTTGIPFANVAVRLRDGSLENLLLTDFTGTANFNETFPLFSWYTVETDVTRYKNTGTHVVYDAGGPADGSTACGVAGYPPCGASTGYNFLANTEEQVSVPANLRVPGAIYCASADCAGKSMNPLTGLTTSDPSNCTGSGSTVSCGTPSLSTGRIDPPSVGIEGWQGFPGQNSFLEFGKAPYFPGENGGIKGHVIYASTRPFDDPYMLVQTQWEPLVPNVTINLYQEGFASDGVTPTLTLVDHTKTSSFDDWAQGFRSDGVPNMNCPGQSTADLFYFTLNKQPNYLDLYNSQHGGAAVTPLPYNSQFKCYDGMHNWNQIQPTPYDGAYQFPSVTSTSTTTGKPMGTNCTICVADPVPAMGDPDADPWHAGLPMLPAGKYVVEVVLPQGYELVKEEDKNILIGDNFIAPVTQQFGGLGNVFILPDQASVAGTFNPNNPQNPTQSFGANPLNGIVPGFVPEPTWPCVGEQRIVPDYISLYPQTKQVAPFAGATRNLCDRKEVTLADQMGAIAKFFIYTSTHIASKFTGGITDDYTSEFDPFSPVFGEKFAPPNMPISVKDWAGNEISRVYSDQWGSYNGMTYSTWEVNPPNPTGYAPTMMVFCMNDPGTGATPDALFDPAYSQFCYELPFMPGTTQYLDTPVVPTSAFAGAGYNNVDCAYPDATPAIKEVDGDGVGPWLSAGGPMTLTITALGDQMVSNNAYMGPAATTAPYNQKTIKRHYGFGTRGPGSSVSIGGYVVPTLSITSWMDTQITVTVPGNNTVPACAIQQQAQYSGSTAQCGQLVITSANGKQSIDAVTVTIGGKAPTHVHATDSIQTAIDMASPGDLLIIDPTCTNTTAAGTACTTPGATSTTNAVSNHNELLLMWKPVRLQGVGAASSILNANTHPAGKLDPWRKQVLCLFGIGPTGTPSDWTPGCSAGWNAFKADPNNPQVDRLPLEAVVGWTASLNGNLAELLQEPTLMGALEGAGITVLSKGVDFHNQDPFQTNGGTPGVFPTGTTLLSFATCTTTDPTTNAVVENPNFPSSFWCNPSSIDGLGITNSSQGGGGVFVHGWGHNLQLANNRVYNNSGTLSGGLNIGQGEFAPSYIQGSALNAAPGSCLTAPVTSIPTGAQLPYCENMNINMHNNYIALNSSTGDELFSATPAGAGGVSICTGADYYMFNYNWVCGNLSTGDGGGVGHLGFIYNGDIEHNTIIFNQSLNPTIPANGGGLLVMGTPDVDPPCGVTTDADCVPPLGSVAPSDGMGPNLVINANLIMGNSAESGSGGGLRFQGANGTEVIAFPRTPAQWYHAKVTNNIIANNVAGWDGGGISLLDALNVDIINNTIINNVTTASAGMLFTTLGGPLASSQGENCTDTTATTSCPQVAGLVSIQNSATLTANLNLPPTPLTVVCPPGHYQGNTATNGTCRRYSYPLLANNVLYQNSAGYIGVGGAVSTQFQQNVVTLYNAFSGTPARSQHAFGECVTGRSYWDLGARGDTTPGNRTSGITLNPQYSLLTPGYGGYGNSNITGDPQSVAPYCNGSRIPPEACGNGGCGYNVPPGIADATVPNPVFNLTPVATVDEGNNWINLRWGPLTMTNPNNGGLLGNYSLAATSSAVDAIPASAPTYAIAPNMDFFGNPRPNPDSDNRIDIGAVELQGNNAPYGVPTLTSITPSKGLRGNTLGVTLIGTNLIGASTVPPVGVTVSGGGVTVTGVTVGSTEITATFAISATATPGIRNVMVTTPGGTSNALPFTVGPYLTSISPTSGLRGTSPTVTLTGAVLTGTTAVTVSGTGVPTSAVTVVNDTTVTATFAIATNAALTARSVSVITNGVTSNTLAAAFTVQAPTVTFSSGAFGGVGTGTTKQLGIVATPVGGPVAFTASNITGSATFTEITDGCSGTTVPLGSTCTITVQFAPGTSTAAMNGVLHVTDDAAGSPQAVALTGNGVAPTYSVAWNAPGTGAFGNQLVGTTGTAQTATITNTSTNGALLTINAVGKSGSNTTQWTTPTFVTGCAALPATLPPGGSCVASVAFHPTSIGLKNATNLTFTLAAPATPTPATLAMTGTGVQAAVTFGGSTALTTGTANRNVKTVLTTITNSGTAPLVISSITITPNNGGSNPGTFSVANPGTLGTTACPIGGTGLAAGAACQVTVTYTPPTTGTLNTITSTLTVTDTGAATPTQTRNYTGN
jgi:hypothetical protein